MPSDKLLTLIENDKDLEAFIKGDRPKADSIEGLALTVAAAFRKTRGSFAVVLPSLFDAQSFMDFIDEFIPADDLLFFPYDEVLRIEAISSSKEMLKERLYALSETLKDHPHVFITHAISLLHEVSSPARFGKAYFTLAKGQILPPRELIARLDLLGYARVRKTEEVFEYSCRGEIIDIFTPSSKDPYRIEYFDDEIDDIRLFSTEDELSFRQADSFSIIPAKENLLTADEIKSGLTRIGAELEEMKKRSPRDSEEISAKTSAFMAQAEESGIDENQIRYLPYFLSSHCSVLSYLRKDRIVFYRSEDISATADNYYMEAAAYFEELRNAQLALAGEMSCFRLEDVLPGIDYQAASYEESSLKVTDIPYHFISVMKAPEMIKSFLGEGYKTYVFLPKARMDRYKEACLEKGEKGLTSDSANLSLIQGHDLARGFLLPFYKIAVFSSREIFGMPEGSSFFLRRFREAKIISKYQDLTPGDYVVHEEQGIGQYLGIREIDGLEYLEIMYDGPDARLFVPLNKYKLIRKYSGKEGVRPKLDKLGGATWARRKAKIRGRVAYLADRLLEIEAQRAGLPGFAFAERDSDEELFANAFPYQLTLAQMRAWKEISRDMMSSHPMDRLLAGDVGFGKTEIAFRAAYKAFLSHKQSALLCPTTVLAEQHFEVAMARFAGFKVRIGLLSRNVSKAQQADTLEKLKNGDIDFIIGTHRLLSNDISFSDLGLLIVDEEQRFGVTHKEKIKELAANIDVLTLTATPIPRTLQMSLLNVRSLSLLDDPPVNRLPIKTYVVRYDKDLIREVIGRELGRTGQVYYLHNRIQTIYKKAEELQKMFPQARIGVVHGQLEPELMSEAMAAFYRGETDILVCTTIIETGLDVPNCNTIIIEKAENFGLAQLYQIKGRVGRSSRLAYAYLTYPDYKVLSDDSRKRLKALKDFTELGSGYKIATEDLNIRGAGDILGKEQAGFIDSIGYDAYMRLLKDVMSEKTLQGKARSAKPSGTRFELSFSLDAHIPSDYASEADRINIYRELFDVSTIAGLSDFEKKTKDIYGHFTKETDNLFLKKRVEIELSEPIFAAFQEYMDHYDIRMSKDYSSSFGMAPRLSSAMEKYDRRKVTPRFTQNYFGLTLQKTSDYLLDLFDIVETLKSLYRPR